jgi:hypothetical protein
MEEPPGADAYDQENSLEISMKIFFYLKIYSYICNTNQLNTSLMSHTKFSNEELELQASSIMNSFKFEKVHEHMIATGWKWYMGRDLYDTPDIESLRVTARSLLSRAIYEPAPVTNVGTGGFMVYKLPWGLRLTFEIASTNS